MANPEALAVVSDALALTRSHPAAPALAVLDLVMKGRQGQTLNFLEVGIFGASLCEPSGAFGQIVAEALDRGMSAADWIWLAGPKADPLMRDTLLDIWRDDVMGVRFAGRYGVTVLGLP